MNTFTVFCSRILRAVARRHTVRASRRFKATPRDITAGALGLAGAAILLAVGTGPGASNDARASAPPPRARTLAINPNPPATPVKLVFIHHSSGENWLRDDHGGLAIALRDNNYFVSDTNYGWGPADYDVGVERIGDHTDLGHWYNWFAGPHRDTYMAALFPESGQTFAFSRLPSDPGGANRIVMFKSCFPNSNLTGNPGDLPTTGANPMRGQAPGSDSYTVANAKGIYNDILTYFATRQDTLWVAITSPPLMAVNTDPGRAANARAFTTWLVHDWLASYPYNNVAVFDFYTVLTTNGGAWNVNDLGASGGNHHRLRAGAIEHITNQGGNTAAYPSGGSDDHPSPAGNQKATGEFVPLLNIFYNRWVGGSVQPTPTPTPTPTSPAPHQVRRRLRSAGGAAGVVCTDPQPTLVTDFLIRQQPVLAEPAARSAFRDPVFGSCLARVTDRARDLTPGDTSGGLKNEYSRVQAFNADETRIMVRGTAATWYVYDAATLQRIAQVPVDGYDPRWDASDPDLLYSFPGPRIVAYNLRTGQASLVHDFAPDFPGQSLVMVWTRYEGSPSRDSRYFGLMAQDQLWHVVAFVVYDRVLDRVIATRDMRAFPTANTVDSVTISPLGDYFVAQFDPCPRGQLGSDASPCGLMVYDRNLANGRGLVRAIGHSDIALDALGREVMVYQNNDVDTISVVDLATGSNLDLWPIDFSHTSIGFHFSGLAFNRPGWAVVSAHGDNPTCFTWMDNHVFLVELKLGGRVVHLAHTHSLVDSRQAHDYWAEPQASVNRDLTKVLFTTNWGRSGTDQVEMYMIRLPGDWPSRLPS